MELLEDGHSIMTARVLCPVGLLFPTGWTLLSRATVGAITTGGGDWGHLVPVEAPGIVAQVGAYLDTHPFLSGREGALVDPCSALGAYLVKSTPSLSANTDIVHLAEREFRNGRSRFTGNGAGYYFRALRDIVVGEPFIVDWELFVCANRWSDNSGSSTGLSLTGPLTFVPGLLSFRRDAVVPPTVPILEGLPAVDNDTTSFAVVGEAIGGSSDGSPGGDASLVGGGGEASPVYYPTGGDPNTHAAHLVPPSTTRVAGPCGDSSIPIIRRICP